MVAVIMHSIFRRPPHHSALVGVIKPFQQLHAGALSTAAGPHKGQRLAGLHCHVQPIEDLDVWSGRVSELAVNELNVPLEVILVEKGGGGANKGGAKVLFWDYSVLRYTARV